MKEQVYNPNCDYLCVGRKMILALYLRKLLFVIFVICCPHFIITCYSQVRISADFERGSMGSLIEVKENSFSGQTMHWIKKDKIGNQYYWFYFKVTNAKGKTL